MALTSQVHNELSLYRSPGSRVLSSTKSSKNKRVVGFGEWDGVVVEQIKVEGWQVLVSLEVRMQSVILYKCGHEQAGCVLIECVLSQATSPSIGSSKCQLSC